MFSVKSYRFGAAGLVLQGLSALRSAVLFAIVVNQSVVICKHDTTS